MRKKRAVALFLCFGIVVLFVLKPELLYKGVDRRFLTQWLRGDIIEYEGFLTVWHVPSLASGTGNGDSFLASAISDFKKANFGVFFNLEIMTAEEMQAKLQAGERPDLISFNGGDISDPASIFQPLENVEALQPNYADAGVYDGVNYACAYMRGASAIIVMDEAFYDVGLSPPAGLEYIDAQWISDVSEMQNIFAIDAKDEMTAAQLLLAETGMEPEGANALAFAHAAEAAAMADDDGPRVMLGSLGTIYRLESTGKDLIYSVYPVEGYVSRLQFMGICKTDDEDKLEACTRFASYLLSAKRQAKLDGVWALPVVDIGDVLTDNISVSPFWHSAGDGDVYILDAYTKTNETEFLQRRNAAAVDGSLVEDTIEWLKQTCVGDS